MKFMFSAHITVSAYTVVEADTAEQAMEIARDRSETGLDFNGSGNAAEEMWLVEDVDGSPKNVEMTGQVDEE